MNTQIPWRMFKSIISYEYGPAGRAEGSMESVFITVSIYSSKMSYIQLRNTSKSVKDRTIFYINWLLNLT